MKTVGVLTGGGDAPGLNAVIRAIVRRSIPRGYQMVGIRHGWLCAAASITGRARLRACRVRPHPDLPHGINRSQ